MAKVENCHSTLLINDKGVFQSDGIKKFREAVGMDKRRAIAVSIMGPQCSGKSTLMNDMFRTDFIVMDGSQGREKTTRGIWIAKAADIEPCTLVQAADIEPCTLVLDLEGTDGRERGNDIAFEKQSALFSLAVSDVLIINMWCTDIGRENAANRPLLKIIFEVMMRLFSPRKTILMFIIRDQTTRIPLSKLESQLKIDIQRIWDSVPKPQVHEGAPLSEFFQVEVVALANYEHQEALFQEQVDSLRQRFFLPIESGGLAADPQNVVVPASEFFSLAQNIWEKIEKERDLNLPAIMVMMATVRCDQIVNDLKSDFAQNKEWRQLHADVQSDCIPNFGRKLKSLLDCYLSKYDEETLHYNKDVKSAKKKVLEEELLKLVQPACKSMLKHLRSKALAKFKAEYKSGSIDSYLQALFDKECEDDIFIKVDGMSEARTEARTMLEVEMKAHVDQMDKKSTFRSMALSILGNVIGGGIGSGIGTGIGNGVTDVLKN